MRKSKFSGGASCEGTKNIFDQTLSVTVYLSITTTTMTKEQLSEEYKWLTRNRLHPEFQKRAAIYNEAIREIKKERAKAAKDLARTFNVGEIVKVNHAKASGLWKIMEIKISFLVLKNVETDKTVKAKASLLERIDKEDSELISDLHEIGL